MFGPCPQCSVQGSGEKQDQCGIVGELFDPVCQTPWQAGAGSHVSDCPTADPKLRHLVEGMSIITSISPAISILFSDCKAPTFIDITCKWYFKRFFKNFLSTHCNCCFGFFQYLGTIKSLHKKADTCDSILNFLKSHDAVDSELRSFWCLETVLYKMSLHCWSGKHKTAANFLQVGDNFWSVLCLVSLESSP